MMASFPYNIYINAYNTNSHTSQVIEQQSCYIVYVSLMCHALHIPAMSKLFCYTQEGYHPLHYSHFTN